MFPTDNVPSPLYLSIPLSPFHTWHIATSLFSFCVFKMNAVIICSKYFLYTFIRQDLLNAFHVSVHLILTTTLEVRKFFSLNFTDDETEAHAYTTERIYTTSLFRQSYSTKLDFLFKKDLI